MQGARKNRIADSSDQIAGSKEKRKDNAETQRTQRTQRFAEMRNPRALATKPALHGRIKRGGEEKNVRDRIESMSDKFAVGLVQMRCTTNKEENLTRAAEKI